MKDEKLYILMSEMVEQQRVKLLQMARQFVPNITSEDLLQPFDYPELESNPYFRYEEGILEGLQAARAAFSV